MLSSPLCPTPCFGEDGARVSGPLRVTVSVVHGDGKIKCQKLHRKQQTFAERSGKIRSRINLSPLEESIQCSIRKANQGVR